MPSDSGTYSHCPLCGQRVDDGFEAEHRGERPPAAGVTKCTILDVAHMERDELIRACAIATDKIMRLERHPEPVPTLLWCPACGERHIDRGEFATRPHHTHACQHCGLTWRPAIVPTVGVQFLPGFKDE